MNKFDELRRLLDQIVLGEIPDDLSNRVFEFVDEDCQLESFLQIIIHSDSDSVCKKELFSRGIKELGWDIPTPVEAARRHLRRIFESILAEEISPYEGALLIEKGHYYHFPEFENDLSLFGTCALEIDWNDDIKAIAYYQKMIAVHCHSLLKTGTY